VHRTCVLRDNRGEFTEVFRSELFAGAFSDQVQVNCTHSRRGVIRGLHFHRFQTDIWFTVSGKMRAVLVDLRPDSPTYRRTEVFDIGVDDPVELLIPPGIAHGYLALSDLSLLYVTNRYYDGSDEYGLAWNDPDLAIDWGTGVPILSERDRSNPCISDMKEEWLRDLLNAQPPDRE
jgi:dTDP-4-dehydrorhamnose 3,5-epimerase